MKKLRWIPPLVAAILLVPWAWAASQVVGVDGSVYSVAVLELGAGTLPGSTALAYSVLRPNGEVQTGFVPSTEDLLADTEPSLVLPPGGTGPFLIWTRSDGTYDQVAYSRYTGTLWTDVQYLTFGARDHIHPQFGVDSQGTAYVVWVEPAGAGSVMIATFDPLAGTLLWGPRDLIWELSGHPTPEWLGHKRDPLAAADQPRGFSAEPALEGGNDAPAIPPCSENSNSSCKAESTLLGGVVLDPACRLVVVVVERNRMLHFGVMENGVVLEYYRSVVPARAPEAYVRMLQEGLLYLHCRAL